MNSIYTKSIFLVFPFLFLLSGCLETSEPGLPNRVALDFRVGNVGTTIERGQDKLNVSGVKLLIDKFNLLTDTEAKLQTDVGPLVMSYSSLDGEYNNVVEGNIAFEDINTFTAIKLFIDKLGSGESVSDPDFSGSDQNYSIVVRGTYNGTDFFYRSQTSFERQLDFAGPVDLGSDSKTLQINILTNVNNFMVDPETNEILSPNESSNTAVIDSLLRKSLNVNASAMNTL